MKLIWGHLIRCTFDEAIAWWNLSYTSERVLRWQLWSILHTRVVNESVSFGIPSLFTWKPILRSSISYCQNFSEQRHLVCIWKPLKVDKRLNFGENGTQWISCADQVIFLQWKTLYRRWKSLIWAMKTYHCQFRYCGSSTTRVEHSAHSIDVAKHETIEKLTK